MNAEFETVDHVGDVRHYLRKAESVYVQYVLNVDQATNMQVTKTHLRKSLADFDSETECRGYYYPDTRELYLLPPSR